MSFPPRLPRIILLASTWILSACDGNQPSVPTAAEYSAHAVEAAGRSGELLDHGISRGDTYLAARVYIERSGNGGAAAAVVQSSQTTRGGSNDYYVEAGYGHQGELRFTLYYGSTVQRPPTSVAYIRSVGDAVTMYDAWGSVLSTASFDHLMFQMGLPGGTLIDAMLGGGNSDPDPCIGCVIIESGSSPTTTVHVNGDIKEIRTLIVPAGAEVSVAASTSEIVRRFERVGRGGAGGPSDRGEHWRLIEVRHSSATTQSVQRFEYTAWHRNPARDGARAAARPTPARRGPDQPRPEGASEQSKAATSTGVASISVCGQETNERNRTLTAGAHSILYQHGICSGASTWDGMAPVLANRLVVGRERAFSLSPQAPLEDQTSELIARLDATGGGSNVVVGHSQGGLIARRLAHRRPELVRGVITVGTPHHGALVANAAPAALAQELRNRVSGALCFGRVCREIIDFTLAPVIDRIVYGAVDQIAEVREDVKPGSAFLNGLNSHPEPFLRAGIESDAGWEWALYRIAGDVRSDRERLLAGERPHGESVVKMVDGLVTVSTFLQILTGQVIYTAYPYGGGILCMGPGYSTYWPPCWDPYYYNYWYQPSYWGSIVANVLYVTDWLVSIIIDLDRFWDTVTTGQVGATDGFIQFHSQRYPHSPGTHAPVRYVILEADSHTGSTASPMVRDGLRTLLSQRMEFDENQLP